MRRLFVLLALVAALSAPSSSYADDGGSYRRPTPSIELSAYADNAR